MRKALIQAPNDGAALEALRQASAALGDKAAMLDRLARTEMEAVDELPLPTGRA